MAFVAERINSIQTPFERVREEVGEEMQGVAQRGFGAHSYVRAMRPKKVGWFFQKTSPSNEFDHIIFIDA